MTFWNQKRQSTVLALLSTCSLLFAFGCGQKNLTATVINDARDSMTGGFNENGQAYTTFSKPSELKKIRVELPTLSTPPNLAFSGLIKWIKIQPLNSGTEVVASVIFQAEGGPRTVVQFRGSVQKEKDQYTAQLKPIFVAENYAKDLAILSSLKLVSNEITFANAQVFFLDTKIQPIAAALVKTETKTALLKSSVSTAEETSATLPKATTTPGKKTQVDVESLQVVNGASAFRLRENVNSAEKVLGQMSLGGEIIETDGQCNPIRTNSQNSKACLVGNSEDGGIVVKITRQDLAVVVPPTPPAQTTSKKPIVKPAPAPAPVDQSKPEEYFWLELPGETKHAASEGQCGIQVTSDHPLVQEIVSACQDNWWMKSDEFVRDRSWKCGKGRCKDPSVEHFFSYNNFADYNKFLKMYETAAPGKVSGKNTKGESLSGSPLIFSQMLQVLEKEGMHKLLGIITYIESHFNPHDRSSAGAKGYWQFMPATAVTFGLSLGVPGDPKKPDQRTQIVPSTRAASRYIKYLLEMKQWKGNYKLSLAGYNWGEGNVRKKLKKIDTPDVAPAAGTIVEPNEENLVDVVEYSKDFWTLFEKKMLPYETRSYVLKFLYGSIVALSPNQYGLPVAPVQQ